MRKVEWLLKASKNGHGGASRELGMLYYNGKGDDEIGKRYFRLAITDAEQGDEAAQSFVASRYKNVEEDDFNPVKALYWFRQSLKGYFDGSEE